MEIDYRGFVTAYVYTILLIFDHRLKGKVERRSQDENNYGTIKSI